MNLMKYYFVYCEISVVFIAPTPALLDTLDIVFMQAVKM